MLRLNYLWVAFLAIFFTTSLSLSAATQTLTPSEIEAFNAQVANAQRIDTALVAKGQCYADKDAELEANSHRLQETAGELHRQEQQLVAELTSAESEVKAFSEALDKELEQKNYLEQRMWYVKNEIRKKESELDSCKRPTGSFFDDILSPFTYIGCELYAEISGLNSDLRNLDNERQQLDMKVKSSREYLKNASDKKDRAEKRLKENREKFDNNKNGIDAVEKEIGMLKVSLAEIRKLKQDNATLLVRFTDSITELNGLDPTSDRRLIVTRLRQESESLNVLLLKSQELLDINGLQLPGGERICTN
ncbi:hypothetical protein ABRP70_18060 [Pectobacterium odoriferum]|uniref:hypothetical protein n=1 Tax=Pectobacterium odoriferum TaxID=78398 RepID=UPI00052AE818|nr:hypothetical protein [Pectobacterium odoriferum]AIU88535.1 hypothetical protein BCS7_10570 [Pectobacterium odoriferum]POE20699.1 hypothetical protein BV918_03275 [Pectobacterium odoriferum]POE37419.1 hypothetical protein BV922_03265 [Pectobacterium odoriferum]